MDGRQAYLAHITSRLVKLLCFGWQAPNSTTNYENDLLFLLFTYPTNGLVPISYGHGRSAGVVTLTVWNRSSSCANTTCIL